MIDSLMEVTARFFKAGTVVYVKIEDEIELTNYGRVYGDGDDEELWEYVPGTEDKVSQQQFIHLDREPHYIIKKDFIGFSFRTFDFGDFGDSHCSGTSFEEREGTLIESLADSTDDFVEYAKEEKAACDAKRQGKYPNKDNLSLLFFPKEDIPETDCVKFIVALDYHSDQSGGGYDHDEYSSWVEVSGKVDMSRIREIIGNRVDALTGVRSRVDKFSLA